MKSMMATINAGEQWYGRDKVDRVNDFVDGKDTEFRNDAYDRLLIPVFLMLRRWPTALPLHNQTDRDRRWFKTIRAPMLDILRFCLQEQGVIIQEKRLELLVDNFLGGIVSAIPDAWERLTVSKYNVLRAWQLDLQTKKIDFDPRNMGELGGLKLEISAGHPLPAPERRKIPARGTRGEIIEALVFKLMCDNCGCSEQHELPGKCAPEYGAELIVPPIEECADAYDQSVRTRNVPGYKAGVFYCPNCQIVTNIIL